MIVAHGFKGFKDWGFFPYVCEALAGAGFAVVSFNFTRNGIGDDPQELTELEAFAANTYTRELDELEQVVRDVSTGQVLPRRPGAIGLLGHSRGGAQAILAAAELNCIDALVTWGAVGDLDRWSDETRAEWKASGRVHVLNGRTGQQMPLNVTLLEDFDGNRDRLDVAAAAARIRAPWLILHGEDDLTVSVRDARRLVAAAPSAKLRVISDAGHTFETRHPFEGPSSALREAMDATTYHLSAELGR